LEEPANGDAPGSWNVPVNGNFTAIDGCFGGVTNIALTNANVTLTTSQYQVLRLKLTGTLTANVSVSIPSTVGGFWIVQNNTTGNYSVTINTTAGGSIGTVAPQGTTSLLVSDGTNVFFGDTGVIVGASSSVINGLQIYNTTATSGKLRWTEGLDGTTESGSNAGSNYIIQSYSDSGTLLSTVATITRSTGAWAMPGPLTVTGAITSNTSVTSNGLLLNPIADGFFRNLQIQVTGNTTLNVSADVFTAFDGTNTMTFRALSVTGAVTSSSGILNGMDTGGPGTNRWVQIWAVGNPSTGGSGVVLTQNAYPTPPSPLPSGYSMYAYCGSVKVDGSTNLYRSIQKGNRFRWQVTPATNTTGNQVISAGSSIGNVGTPTYVGFVVQALTGASPLAVCPPTATAISMVMGNVGSSAVGQVMVAPNNNYGKDNSTSNPPPLMTYYESIINGDLVLESSSIYAAANSGGAVYIASSGFICNVNAS